MSEAATDVLVSHAPDPVAPAAGGHGPEAAHGTPPGPHGGPKKEGRVRHMLKTAVHGAPAPVTPGAGEPFAPAAPEPVATPEPPKDVHLRSEFVRDASDEDVKVEFGPELKTRYANVLSNHVRTLEHLRETNPKIFDNPKFTEDKALFDALTSDGRVDMAKVDTYLGTAQGKISANLVLENNVRIRSFAFGLDVVAHGSAQKDPLSTVTDMLAEKSSTDRRIGGPLTSSAVAGAVGAVSGLTFQEVWDRGIGAVAGKVGDAAVFAGGKAVDAAQAINEWLASHPDARSAAVGGGLGLAINAGLRRHMGPHAPKEAPKSELEAYADGLDYIKGDSDLAEYVREMTGIEVEDFEVDSGIVKLVEGKATTFNIAATLKEMDGLLDTRKDFLKTLGFPEEQIEGKRPERKWKRKKKDDHEPSGNDQRFTRPDAEGTAQLRTWWDDEIDAEYGKLLNEKGVDYSDELFGEARTTVAMRYHERALEAAGMDVPDKAKMIGNIEEGIRKLEGSPGENRDKYQAELDRLRTDNDQLDSGLSFTTNAAEINKQYLDALNNFQTAYPGETDLESAIDARNKRLTQDADGKTHYDRTREAEEQKRTNELDRLRTGDRYEDILKIARENLQLVQDEFARSQEGLPDKMRKAPMTEAQMQELLNKDIKTQLEAQEKQINDRYDARVKEVEDRKAEDIKEIREMVGLRKEFGDHAESLSEARMQELVRDDMMGRDFAEISALTGDDAVDLSQTADQLIDGKTSPAVRQKLINARLHSMRDELVKSAGLIEPDLTGKTDDEIALLTGEYQNRLKRVHDMATRQAYETVRQELQRKTADLTEKARTGELSEGDKTKVENGHIAVDLGAHISDVSGRARSVDFAKLTDNTKIKDVKGEEFSSAETTDTLKEEPVAYNRLLGVMFDFDAGHDLNGKHLGRAEYFEEISKLLPPKDLAKIIDESGVLGSSISKVDMSKIAKRMDELYKDNGFTQVELRRLTRYVTRRLMERVNAQF